MSISRRNFIQQGLVYSAAALTPGLNTLAATENRIERIGIQLYTLRDRMARDVKGTLGALAEIGYSEVEFAGYFDHSASRIREMLNELGLASPSAHIPLEALEADAGQTIDAAATAGHKYIVVPYLMPARRVSIDQYRKLAEQFNKFGELCARSDIQFAYHNHDFEFAAIDSVVPYDLLLDETDPELVKMELDLFWLKKAQGNPMEYFQRYPQRFPLCHVKDMNAAGDMVDVGRGSIDFARVFKHIEKAGLKHFFVEHDAPTDSMESALFSYNTVDSLRF